MGFNCGIVGLPNVGKSTLFNALTQTAAAEAANYPFCTIEPNTGRVSVPDKRQDTLATIAQSQNTTPTQLEFVDIAGLVKGASKGEGLGNQFLSHIREVDAIAHVVRCFEDSDITHVETSIDPLRDIEIIETELILADLESIDKRMESLQKKIKAHDKDALLLMSVLERIKTLLDEGKPARSLQVDKEELPLLKQLHLITLKPIMYVCNVAEEDAAQGNTFSDQVVAYAKTHEASCVVISAQIEEEIASLPDEEEKREFLATIGLEETGLSRVIKAGYDLLDLITFFTVGPKETRAWTVRKGTLAPQAGAVIHTDFEKGFIRAETIDYQDFVDHKGEQGAKDAGKTRLEGKEYIVKDGDIVHFRFNV